VLKPEGNLFVNLGDKYSSGNSGQSGLAELGKRWAGGGHSDGKAKRPSAAVPGYPPKSLLGLPWRYAIGCTDQLGLILRAEIIWAKPNGLPESVTDRVRRAHEQVFHFTRQPRYYAAVDEIREPHTGNTHARRKDGLMSPKEIATVDNGHRRGFFPEDRENPLGKLPGSVWDIPSAPLQVPACRLVLGGRTVRWFMTWEQGHAHMRRLARYGWDGHGRPSLRPEIDHFAAFPPALVRPIVLGWSPPGVCTACGHGRRPVSATEYVNDRRNKRSELRTGFDRYAVAHRKPTLSDGPGCTTITGYACACPQPDAPTTPAVVLDPFGGTGTTALVASCYGRVGVTVDLSADYCRLAHWRVNDPGECARARAMPKPPPVPDGMEPLFTM
jgi:hypothetical protein